MKEPQFLDKALSQAKLGEMEGYENLYLLTYQDTYGRLMAIVKDESKAEILLADVYREVARTMKGAPEKEPEEWLQALIWSQAEKKHGIEKRELTEEDLELSAIKISEDRAITILMKLVEDGEIAGRFPGDASSRRLKTGDIIKISVSAFVLCATAAVLVAGVNHVRTDITSIETQVVVETTTEPVYSYGWVNAEQGRMFWGDQDGFLSETWIEGEGGISYIRQDGTAAMGEVALGNRIYTFSPDGILKAIRLSEEPDNEGFYNESVHYYVRSGDIYRREAQGKEECIVLNGHVVQLTMMDDGIGYVTRYQIPNSERVKMALGWCSWDGEEKLKIADSIMGTSVDILQADDDLWVYGNDVSLYYYDSKTGDNDRIADSNITAYSCGRTLQVSDGWIYYMQEDEGGGSSGTKLYRVRPAENSRELMAEDIEAYFPYGGGAYYASGYEIAKASTGLREVFSEAEDAGGVSQKGLILKKGSGFYLLDSQGNQAMADDGGVKEVGDIVYGLEEGRIISVEPGDHTKNGINYFLFRENGKPGDSIYLNTETSKTSGRLFAWKGQGIDSFCLSDSYLYYSAYMGQRDGKPYSQMYQVSFSGHDRKAVGKPFAGRLMNLYHDAAMDKIYGDLRIDEENRVQGRIAEISYKGEMEPLGDSSIGEVFDSKGNFTLSFVGADEEGIYAFWNECSISGDEAEEILWSKPVEIRTKEETEEEAIEEAKEDQAGMEAVD